MNHYLELAEGGTLLLNEIGEKDLRLQAKLLTFLDSKEFVRVGGTTNLRVDVRIIASTNQDPEIMVQQKKFRADLFYRLNVFPIKVPALRDRLEDIPMLVRDILRGLMSQTGRATLPVVDPAALHLLQSYHWPGNVRVLRNVL